LLERERVRRTLTFQSPDRVPRELWALPGVRMFRQQELGAVLTRFPSDFIEPNFSYGVGKKERGTRAMVGNYTDEWGCIFEVREPGVIGEVKKPPLADWTKIDHLKPPYEILENADLSLVNKSCAETGKFVKVSTTVRPFERIQFLRGTENLLMDLAWGVREVFQLLEMVHEFYLQELSLWLETEVDGISMMDDWGSQTNLLISPEMWRKIFRPLYADYYQLIHGAQKFVFFHSDGNIMKIIPDLIELGLDALNSQLFCMDIEEIGRLFKGKITFWGEIDRQQILPFGTVKEVQEAVWRVRSALDDGRGGVIAQCEWGNDVPRENIEAVFKTWKNPRGVPDGE
jgi:uroporphyrinogen decarboxylase